MYTSNVGCSEEFLIRSYPGMFRLADYRKFGASCWMSMASVSTKEIESHSWTFIGPAMPVGIVW